MVCFENIIGLTDSTCECFDVPHVESEIYITDCIGTEILKTLFCSGSCGDDFYVGANKVLKKSVSEFLGKLKTAIKVQYQENPNYFHDKQFGYKSYDNSVQKINSDIALVGFNVNRHKASKLVIHDIGLVPFKKNGVLAKPCIIVNVFDFECKPIEYAIEIQTDKCIVWANLEEDICLPLDCDNNQFYIAYDLPKNTYPCKHYDHCNCGSVKRPKHYDAISYEIGEANDIRDFKTKKSCNKRRCATNGLLLKMSLKCDFDELLCCLYEDNKEAFHTLITHRAISDLISYIGVQGGLDYTNICKKEDLVSIAEYHLEQYESIISSPDFLKSFCLDNYSCLCRKNTMTRKTSFG